MQLLRDETLQLLTGPRGLYFILFVSVWERGHFVSLHLHFHVMPLNPEKEFIYWDGPGLIMVNQAESQNEGLVATYWQGPLVHSVCWEGPELSCFPHYALHAYATCVKHYREVLYSVIAMLSLNQQTMTCPDQL